MPRNTVFKIPGPMIGHVDFERLSAELILSRDDIQSIKCDPNQLGASARCLYLLALAQIELGKIKQKISKLINQDSLEYLHVPSLVDQLFLNVPPEFPVGMDITLYKKACIIMLSMHLASIDHTYIIDLGVSISVTPGSERQVIYFEDEFLSIFTRFYEDFALGADDYFEHPFSNKPFKKTILSLNELSLFHYVTCPEIDRDHPRSRLIEQMLSPKERKKTSQRALYYTCFYKLWNNTGSAHTVFLIPYTAAQQQLARLSLEKSLINPCVTVLCVAPTTDVATVEAYPEKKSGLTQTLYLAEKNDLLFAKRYDAHLLPYNTLPVTYQIDQLLNLATAERSKSVQNPNYVMTPVLAPGAKVRRGKGKGASVRAQLTISHTIAAQRINTLQHNVQTQLTTSHMLEKKSEVQKGKQLSYESFVRLIMKYAHYMYNETHSSAMEQLLAQERHYLPHLRAGQLNPFCQYRDQYLRLSQHQYAEAYARQLMGLTPHLKPRKNVGLSQISEAVAEKLLQYYGEYFQRFDLYAPRTTDQGETLDVILDWEYSDRFINDGEHAIRYEADPIEASIKQRTRDDARLLVVSDSGVPNPVVEGLDSVTEVLSIKAQLYLPEAKIRRSAEQENLIEAAKNLSTPEVLTAMFIEYVRKDEYGWIDRLNDNYFLTQLLKSHNLDTAEQKEKLIHDKFGGMFEAIYQDSPENILYCVSMLQAGSLAGIVELLTLLWALEPYGMLPIVMARMRAMPYGVIAPLEFTWSLRFFLQYLQAHPAQRSSAELRLFRDAITAFSQAGQTVDLIALSQQIDAFYATYCDLNRQDLTIPNFADFIATLFDSTGQPRIAIGMTTSKAYFAYLTESLQRAKRAAVLAMQIEALPNLSFAYADVPHALVVDGFQVITPEMEISENSFSKNETSYQIARESLQKEALLPTSHFPLKRALYRYLGVNKPADIAVLKSLDAQMLSFGEDAQIVLYRMLTWLYAEDPFFSVKNEHGQALIAVIVKDPTLFLSRVMPAIEVLQTYYNVSATDTKIKLIHIYLACLNRDVTFNEARFVEVAKRFHENPQAYEHLLGATVFELSPTVSLQHFFQGLPNIKPSGTLSQVEAEQHFLKKTVDCGDLPYFIGQNQQAIPGLVTNILKGQRSVFQNSLTRFKKNADLNQEQKNIIKKLRHWVFNQFIPDLNSSPLVAAQLNHLIEMMGEKFPQQFPYVVLADYLKQTLRVSGITQTFFKASIAVLIELIRNHSDAETLLATIQQYTEAVTFITVERNAEFVLLTETPTIATIRQFEMLDFYKKTNARLNSDELLALRDIAKAFPPGQKTLLTADVKGAALDNGYAWQFILDRKLTLLMSNHHFLPTLAELMQASYPQYALAQVMHRLIRMPDEQVPLFIGLLRKTKPSLNVLKFSFDGISEEKLQTFKSIFDLPHTFSAQQIEYILALSDEQALLLLRILNSHKVLSTEQQDRILKANPIHLEQEYLKLLREKRPSGSRLALGPSKLFDIRRFKYSNDGKSKEPLQAIEQRRLLADYELLCQLLADDSQEIIVGKKLADLTEDDIKQLYHILSKTIADLAPNTSSRRQYEIALIACCSELIFRFHGEALYPTQLLAALIELNSDDNKIIQKPMGAGKTNTILLQILMASGIKGRVSAIDVLCEERDMAERDLAYALPVLKALAIPVCEHLIDADSDPKDYLNGVRFSSPSAIALFHMKQQLQHNRILYPEQVVLDEIDALLNSSVDFRIAELVDDFDGDKEVAAYFFNLVLAFAADNALFLENYCNRFQDEDNLRKYINFHLKTDPIGNYRFLQRLKKVMADNKLSSSKKLISKLIQAAQIAHSLRDGKDYKTFMHETQPEFLQAVPMVNHRPAPEVTFGGGTQQLLSVKLNNGQAENDPQYILDQTTETTLSCSPKNLLDHYRLHGARLTGYTATPGIPENVAEYERQHGFSTYYIPSPKKSRRKKSYQQYKSGELLQALQAHLNANPGRPILIVADDAKIATQLHDEIAQLDNEKFKVHVQCAIGDIKNNKALVSRADQNGVITVANYCLIRAVNIIPEHEEGLLELLVCEDMTPEEYTQAKGRTARFGGPGEVIVLFPDTYPDKAAFKQHRRDIALQRKQERLERQLIADVKDNIIYHIYDPLFTQLKQRLADETQVVYLSKLQKLYKSLCKELNQNIDELFEEFDFAAYPDNPDTLNVVINAAAQHVHSAIKAVAIVVTKFNPLPVCDEHVLSVCSADTPIAELASIGNVFSLLLSNLSDDDADHLQSFSLVNALEPEFLKIEALEKVYALFQRSRATQPLESEYAFLTNFYRDYLTLRFHDGVRKVRENWLIARTLGFSVANLTALGKFILNEKNIFEVLNGAIPGKANLIDSIISLVGWSKFFIEKNILDPDRLEHQHFSRQEELQLFRLTYETIVMTLKLLKNKKISEMTMHDLFTVATPLLTTPLFEIYCRRVDASPEARARGLNGDKLIALKQYFYEFIAFMAKKSPDRSVVDYIKNFDWADLENMFIELSAAQKPDVIPVESKWIELIAQIDKLSWRAFSSLGLFQKAELLQLATHPYFVELLTKLDENMTVGQLSRLMRTPVDTMNPELPAQAFAEYRAKQQENNAQQLHDLSVYTEMVLEHIRPNEAKLAEDIRVAMRSRLLEREEVIADPKDESAAQYSKLVYTPIDLSRRVVPRGQVVNRDRILARLPLHVEMPTPNTPNDSLEKYQKMAMGLIDNYLSAHRFWGKNRISNDRRQAALKLRENIRLCQNPADLRPMLLAAFMSASEDDQRVTTRSRFALFFGKILRHRKGYSRFLEVINVLEKHALLLDLSPVSIFDARMQALQKLGHMQSQLKELAEIAKLSDAEQSAIEKFRNLDLHDHPNEIHVISELRAAQSVILSLHHQTASTKNQHAVRAVTNMALVEINHVSSLFDVLPDVAPKNRI